MTDNHKRQHYESDTNTYEKQKAEGYMAWHLK